MPDLDSSAALTAAPPPEGPHAAWPGPAGAGSRAGSARALAVGDAPAASGIVLRGVEHVYRAQNGAFVPALARIDVALDPGSFVALLGPSGCGKSTLLRIISGLLSPTRGQVVLDGQSPSLARRRRAIGWLAQDDGLLPWLSVADNVGLALRVAGARDRQAELEMLERVGLGGTASRYPHELSGGMRQRAALARALLARPPFVLLDEPFAHLDELTRERLGQLVLDLRSGLPTPLPDPRASVAAAGPGRDRAGSASAGRGHGPAAATPTTVLVTHSVAEAVRLADRVLLFSPRPGRVLVDVDVAARLGDERHEDSQAFAALVRELKGVVFASPTLSSSSSFRPTDARPADALEATGA